MDSFLSVKPGLLIWSAINFLLFLFVLYKIGGKHFIHNLKQRGITIQSQIDAAKAAEAEAAELVQKHQAALENARLDAAKVLAAAEAEGRHNADEMLAEAHTQRQQLLAAAEAEVKRQKDAAKGQLVSEMADLVTAATKAVLKQNLTANIDKQMIHQWLQKNNN